MLRRVNQAARSTAFVVAMNLFAPSAGARPECISVTAEAIYRNFGYDHFVHIANGCTEPVVCDVSTDVNPTPQRVAIAPTESADVFTFRGSPTRVFTPRVDCHDAR